MLHALVLAASLGAQPFVPPPPSRMLEMHVGDHRVLVFRDRALRHWSTTMHGIFAVTLVQTDPDGRRLRMWVDAKLPGVATIDVCGAGSHQVWLVKVLP